MTGRIQFIKDADVTADLDAKLIDIISSCFDDQPIFKERRYYKECPPYRWLIEEEGRIIAHAALHEKIIIVNDTKIKIGGVAEVCVRPEHRGKGLVKDLMQTMETWMKENSYEYAMLFGKTQVYASSGYFDIENEIKYTDHTTNQVKTEKNICAMVKLLSDKLWPGGIVNLNGPTF